MQVYRILNRYKLAEALAIVGHLSACIDVSLDLPLRRLDATPSLAEPFVQWANNCFPDRQSRTALAWGLYRASRFLLLSNAADYKSEILTFELSKLQALFNAVYETYDPEGEQALEDQDVPLWGYRTFQQQHWIQEFYGSQLGRSQLMFRELQEAKGLYSEIDALFSKHYGMSSNEWIMTMFALALLSPGVFRGSINTTSPQLNTFLTEQKLRPIFERLSVSNVDYKACVLSGPSNIPIKVKELYAFEPLHLTPFIRTDPKFIGVPYVVPSTACLLYKTTAGFFYEAAELHELENGLKGSRDFRTRVGTEVLKQYLLHFFRHFCPGSIEVVDLDEDNDNKRPDIALIQDGNCLLIEVKLRVMNVGSRYLGGLELVSKHFEKDEPLRTGLEQLMTFKADVVAGTSLLGPMRDVGTCLASYDMPSMANSYLLDVVGQHLGQDLVENLQFASFGECEDLAVYSRSAAAPLSDLIRKSRSELLNQHERTWPLHAFYKSVYRDLDYDNELVRTTTTEVLSEWKTIIGSVRA